MTQPTWLARGEHSDRWIVIAPGTPIGAASAVARLDAALQGFAGGVPRWYVRVAALGRWWLPIWIAICLPLAWVTVPVHPVLRVVVGLAVGVLLLPVGRAGFHALAVARSRRLAGADARKVVVDLAHVARAVPPGAAEQATAIVAADPRRADLMHTLLWQASEASPAAEPARHELLVLHHDLPAAAEPDVPAPDPWDMSDLERRGAV
jgi:hypothetical protein